jgi:hypothetical protein
MLPYQSYQLSEAGRPLSPAAQREADIRTGELAAAISRPITAASARIRTALRVPARIRPDSAHRGTDAISPAPARRAPHQAAESECLRRGQSDRSYAAR